MTYLAFLARSGKEVAADAGSPIFAYVAVALLVSSMALALWILKSDRFANDTFFRRRAKFMLILGPILIVVFVALTLAR